MCTAELVPITTIAAWTEGEYRFVLLPNGSCSSFKKSWDNIGEAIAAMKPGVAVKKKGEGEARQKASGKRS